MPKPVRPDSTPVLRLEPEKRNLPAVRSHVHSSGSAGGIRTGTGQFLRGAHPMMSSARGTPILRDAARRSFYF